MAREKLDLALVVVTTPDGEETELNMDSCGAGNLDEETAQALMIGRAVRAALMSSEGDGATIEVCIYTR